MTAPSLRYREEDRSRYERILSFINVSKRILAKRMELGLSQDALGKAVGSKQSKISEIELMKGNPRFDTLDRIARELGLVIDLVPIEESLRGSPFERAGFHTSKSGTVGRFSTIAIKFVVAGTDDKTYGGLGYLPPKQWVPSQPWSPPVSESTR